MSKYIEAKVRYPKTQENGTVKQVTETYLVDAMSFTEAEARTVEEVAPYMSGDFNVSAVKKSNISEVVGSGSDNEILNDARFYKVKINFINVNERTGAEKKTACHFLVEAVDFYNAVENFNDYMKSTMADFEIAAVVESNITTVVELKKTTEA